MSDVQEAGYRLYSGWLRKCKPQQLETDAQLCKRCVSFRLGYSVKFQISTFNGTIYFKKKSFPGIYCSLVEFAGRVQYGPDSIRAGVVSYGDTASLDIALSAEPTLNGFRSAVDKIGFLNQGTNTAAGIAMLRTKLFSSHYGTVS